LEVDLNKKRIQDGEEGDNVSEDEGNQSTLYESKRI
jgi:hypothetical protein